MSDLAAFAELISLDHGLCVVNTVRGDGSVQSTVVNAGVLEHPRSGGLVVGLVAVGGSRKLRNLRAEPRVTSRVHQPAGVMTREDLLELCAGLPEVVEDYPFGENVAVFKIGGRMFALIRLDGDPGSVNLKCDPELALELRARYRSVRPGYHQNKRHWNTVELDGSIDDSELRWMVDHSYELVAAHLPRAIRDRFHRS